MKSVISDNDIALAKKYSVNGFELSPHPFWLCIWKQENKPKEEITGKYLFFCEDREKLIQLAIEIMEKYTLFEAKVPSEATKTGKDWVLCIYDTEPKLKDELRKYNSTEIRYRCWKSNPETRQGKYSKEFLDAGGYSKSKKILEKLQKKAVK